MTDISDKYTWIRPEWRDEPHKNKDISRWAFASSLIGSIFIVVLYWGYTSDDAILLQYLNIVKYGIIGLIGISLYEYYKTKSWIVIAPIIAALTLVWFAGFDSAYRWDAIQHVTRTKYYMTYDFFNSDERHSFLYVIWGFIYRLFGESEAVTHITNMVLGYAGICGISVLAKEIYGKFEAGLALIVALALPTLFLVNKWAYLDVPFMSFVIFSMVFLIKYVRTTTPYFIWLSLICAFIATGIKMPGIVLFPLIFVVIYGYKLISRSSVVPVAIGSAAALYYLITVMFTITKFQNFQSDFSTVTPLNFGFDAITLWISSLNQEILMVMCSGLLLLSILPFLKLERGNLYYTVLLFAQVAVILGLSLFPSNNLYADPVVPAQNFAYYYALLGIVAATTLLYLMFQKISINKDKIKESGFLLLWAGIFVLFFMINTRIYGYGTKDLFDVAILDFRYLLPALPPIVILFSRGVTTALSSDIRPVLKKSCIVIVSLILVTNIIMSFNLSFYFASSGSSHLTGYEKAANLTENTIIYTHWPFYYNAQNEFPDIGRFDWESANKSPEPIWAASYIPGSALLFDNHFFHSEDLLNTNITTIISRSPYLDPVLPEVSEKNADTVSFGRVNDTSYKLEGLYPSENWNNVSTRWMGDNVSIEMYSLENCTVMLGFNARSFARPREIEICNGNIIIANLTIPIQFAPFAVPINLHKGENIIEISAPGGSERPCDIQELESHDTRYLSIAIQNLTLNKI